MTAQIRFEFIKRELADLGVQFPADGFGKLRQAPVCGAGLNHKKLFPLCPAQTASESAAESGIIEFDQRQTASGQILVEQNNRNPLGKTGKIFPVLRTGRGR